jgi:succinate dehydrogenase / fumarate reductase cytochrome b subunit
MSQENKKIKRPLSPHLQVYKLPMTAKMSISHRMTGVLLTFGLILLSAWVIAAAFGEETYNGFMGLIDTPITKFIFLGWAFVLFYHMGNGFRHLFWDMGIGISEKAAVKTGVLVLLFALGVTFFFWWVTCDCNVVSAITDGAAEVNNATE